jgi:hypothetical protein
MHSKKRVRVKQETWSKNKNKFDEVITTKGRFEKADVTRQNAEYTPTINTHMIIIKNKLLDVFAKKGKFEEADVTTLTAEYTLTINTLVNIVTRNIKNKFDEVLAKKGQVQEDRREETVR